MDILIGISLLVVLSLLISYISATIDIGEKTTNYKTSVEKYFRNLDSFTPDTLIAKTGIGDTPSSALAIDNERRLVMIVKEKKVTSFTFEEIIECEIISEGRSVTKTSRINQFAGLAIGAALADEAGAVIGGLSAQKVTTSNIESVVLKLTLNLIENPVHLIDFIEQGSSVDEAMKEATAINDVFTVIIRQCENNYLSKRDGSEASTTEQLIKLTNLYEQDLLTDDEFTSAKIKILS